jgi:hypothetical protein
VYLISSRYLLPAWGHIFPAAGHGHAMLTDAIPVRTISIHGGPDGYHRLKQVCRWDDEPVFKTEHGISGIIPDENDSESSTAGKCRPSVSQGLEIKGPNGLFEQCKRLFHVGPSVACLEIAGNSSIVTALEFCFDAVAREIKFEVHGVTGFRAEPP